MTIISIFFLFIQVTNDQIDFVKAFNKLSDEEKMKLLETLTDDERKNFFNLRTEYEKYIIILE